MRKAVILAGGLGTRLSEETQLKPKPMIEIGGRPILWHIMKIYASHGVREFIVCCGYKGYMIKEYFHNYFLHTSDVTFDLGSGDMQVHARRSEDWKVTLVDTGDATMTGGRLKAVAPFIKDEEAFAFTYGDGVSDVDLTALFAYHKSHGKDATVTAVAPPGRFGALEIEDGRVERFSEKPKGEGALINGGFFVLSPSVIDRIEGPSTVWENEPLMGLAKDQQLMSFEHDGFWQPMDTLREKNLLEDQWSNGRAAWKIW